MTEAIEVGPIGIWSSALRSEDEAEACDAAAELEELGYGALWFPGRGDGVFERAGALLAATSRIAVATGILSIWDIPAAETAAAHAQLRTAHPGRFLLGLGVSHGPIVDREQAGRYRRPFTRMREYLDELDAAPDPAPESERAIAALRPRMLELARDRTAGTHPYLVTPEHTRGAREILGHGPLVASEQGVVLERDPGRARELARNHLAVYAKLPNYTSNWQRSGFSEEEIKGCSDRLVDALVAWGDPGSIVERVAAHHAAGADHVCIQVLAETQAFPREAWPKLAEALGTGSRRG